MQSKQGVFSEVRCGECSALLIQAIRFLPLCRTTLFLGSQLIYLSRTRTFLRDLETQLGVFFFIHRSIKIRPVSVKTFDEVTMEDGTDDNLGVSHTNVVLELNTCFVEFHKALCSAQFDSVSGSCSEWFVPTFSLHHDACSLVCIWLTTSVQLLLFTVIESHIHSPGLSLENVKHQYKEFWDYIIYYGNILYLKL